MHLYCLSVYNTCCLWACQRNVEYADYINCRKVRPFQHKMGVLSMVLSDNSPVGWGCRIYQLQRGKTLPTSVLHMTLNNLMVRPQ